MSVAGRRPVVGILGGTFDPVHVGHIRIAEQVRRTLGIDEVRLLLAAQPPHKDAIRLSPAHHRAEMVRLAVERLPGIELSTRELENDRVGYTIDTLTALRDGVPPVEPIFLVGADSVFELESWHEARRLVAEFDFVAVNRPGSEFDRASDRLPGWIASRIVPLLPVPPAGGTRGRAPGSGGRIYQLTIEPNPVSSSAIRLIAAAGEDLGTLVPPVVAGYISKHGLYRREEKH